jgi:hypothetical protein
MMLRLRWICGLISTRDYDCRARKMSSGMIAESRVKTLERSLSEDRLAILIFLAGAVILAYTLLNAPAFRDLVN